MKNTKFYSPLVILFLIFFGTYLHACASTQTQDVYPTKTIYLTMDMDMSAWMHRQYLSGKITNWYDTDLFNYLIENKIPVTFFVSGLFAQTYPGLIEKLNSTNNYSFQNHSYDESSFIPNCYKLQDLATDSEKIDQIYQTQNILTEITGRPPTQFRFPGDCHTPADDQLVTNLGLEINNGTIIAGDPFNSNADAIVANIMSEAKNNVVILMHIGGHNAPEDLTVLRQIIPALKKDGYSFALIK